MSLFLSRTLPNADYTNNHPYVRALPPLIYTQRAVRPACMRHDIFGEPPRSALYLLPPPPPPALRNTRKTPRLRISNLIIARQRGNWCSCLFHDSTLRRFLPHIPRFFAAHTEIVWNPNISDSFKIPAFYGPLWLLRPESPSWM